MSSCNSVSIRSINDPPDYINGEYAPSIRKDPVNNDFVIIGRLRTKRYATLEEAKCALLSFSGPGKPCEEPSSLPSSSQDDCSETSDHHCVNDIDVIPKKRQRMNEDVSKDDSECIPEEVSEFIRKQISEYLFESVSADDTATNSESAPFVQYDPKTHKFFIGGRYRTKTYDTEEDAKGDLLNFSGSWK